MIQMPTTKYARSGDVSIAYQVIGDGPIDVVVLPGTISHIELLWEVPTAVHFLERIASFARVILFDRRGSGLSDPVVAVPTLEERIDDARAVMEAAGSRQAALFGISEGVPTALLFAATHPESVTQLVLYGGMARSTWAEDYPWATPRDALLESSEQMAPHLYDGAFIEIMAPSIQDDPNARALFAKLQRYSMTPGMLQQSYLMFLDIDVRSTLATIDVPTLVLHRRGDMAVNRRGAEWMAQQIPGAKYVELSGIDHSLFAGDTDLIADEVEEFLTGSRQSRDVDRVLATVMFTDIVDSTQRASAMGDRQWRDLLDAQNGVLRRELERFRGREVKTLGDGMLATFDGPARAIRCGQAMIDAVRPLGIEIRVGLHTGEIELVGGSDQPDVAGIAVHIAARVGAKAGTGEVLVSGTVKDLVAGSGIVFADRGEHVLKGIPDQWRLYAVEGVPQ